MALTLGNFEHKFLSLKSLRVNLFICCQLMYRQLDIKPFKLSI